MALARDTLLVAGPPDELAADGGRLWVINLTDGRKRQEVRLDAPPVFDGLAVASGGVYISATDGTLSCFGRK